MTSGPDCEAQQIPGMDYGWAKASDAEEVTALFAKTFGRPLSADYYRWQFFEGCEDEGRCGVVRDEGQIISHVGYSPRRASINGAEGRVALKFTSMSDPDYQGRGIYTSLMQWSHRQLQEAGFGFVLSWPNARNHPSQRNRTDYEDLWQIPALCWSPAASGGGQGGADMPFPKAADVDLAMWEPVALASAGDAKYCLVRNAQYLKWRYQHHPDTTYYAIESRQGGALEAALVFKLYPEDKPDRINVVEWLCDPGERGGAVVLEALEDYAARAGLPIMMWHNVHDYPRHHLLERRGYVPSAPVFYFGAFALGDGASLGEYTRWRSWYTSMGDVDVF